MVLCGLILGCWFCGSVCVRGWVFENLSVYVGLYIDRVCIFFMRVVRIRLDVLFLFEIDDDLNVFL